MWILNITYSINLGVQEAATALIGNQIGAMNVDLAKKYTGVIAINGFIVVSIVSVCLFVFRFEIIKLFTSDETLTSTVLTLIPITCGIFIYIDAPLTILQGCVRALGI